MVRLPYWIREDSSPDNFPALDNALSEPNGLLAVGGDLSPARLLRAYRRGIFPWFNDGQHILWWSPEPRAVLFPQQILVSRSLRKTLRQKRFVVTVDRAFEAVMHGCAAPRQHQDGTWISRAMLTAYTRLHELGFAHSIECWANERLAGGLYGVALGRIFFGESMFSRERDASKVALVHLCRADLAMIDCQIPSEHLARMGAVTIPRRMFVALLERWCDLPGPHWGMLETRHSS